MSTITIKKITRVFSVSRCTSGVLGILYDSTSEKKGCTIDETSGLPTETCEFVPMQQTKAKASLMFAEELGSVSNIYFQASSAIISNFSKE